MPTDSASSPEPETLPEGFVEQLQRFDKQQLKEVIHYAQDIIADHHRPTATEIDKERENILRVEERPEYTEVVRSEESSNILYHVTKESPPGDSEELHWRYIGPVIDDE